MSRNQTSGTSRRGIPSFLSAESNPQLRAEGAPTSSSVTAAGAADRAHASWRGSGAPKAAVSPPAVTDFFYFGPAGCPSSAPSSGVAANDPAAGPSSNTARPAVSAPIEGGTSKEKGTAGRAGLGMTDLSLDYDPPPLDGGPLDGVLGLLDSLRSAARDCREAAAPCPRCARYGVHAHGCGVGALS